MDQIKNSIMQKLRGYAIFLLIPVHILEYWTIRTPDRKEIFFAVTLLVLAADFALSFWQMRIFTAKHSRIGAFARAYLPYLGEKAVIALLEGVPYLVYHVRHGWGFGLFSDSFDLDLWHFICMCAMLLGALVTFVTGAGRTMLYHDHQN